MYDGREFPLETGGNVYYNGARPYFGEKGAAVEADPGPRARIASDDGRMYLHLTFDNPVPKSNATPVTTELLGKARISGLPYENADGTPLKIDTDYSGRPRHRAHPTPGPFEDGGTGTLILRIR